jgi:quinoprotein glucose dehydrogenase
VDDLVKPKNPNQDSLAWIHGPEDRKGCCSQMELLGPRGLPLTKPPYGRITAIDMNRGEHVWMIANGDGPRHHPLLKHLNLPPLGQAGRPFHCSRRRCSSAARGAF